MGTVAPRHKILKTTGSKKGNQISYFFSLKSPVKRPPSRFPSGAPIERDSRLQGILQFFISLKDLIKIPLIGRPQEINAHPCSPPNWGPYGNRPNSPEPTNDSSTTYSHVCFWFTVSVFPYKSSFLT